MMFSDPLVLTYSALVALAIFGLLLVTRLRNRWLAWLAGLAVTAAVIWLALGSGFSIRLPYHHSRMQVIVFTVHGQRVHALARPVDDPRAQPMHIVFSIDPSTAAGARMRKSFFAAVRRREGKAHKEKIIINMRGYMTEQGTYKYRIPPPLPPKQRP